MKTIIVFLLLAFVGFCCSEDSDESAAFNVCHEGVVIGKIRSSGGGIAVSMTNATLSSHEWDGYNHVIEALNIPHDLRPGTRIYFFARLPTKQESQYPITTDGGESNKPLIFVLRFSEVSCPQPDIMTPRVE